MATEEQGRDLAIIYGRTAAGVPVAFLLNANGSLSLAAAEIEIGKVVLKNDPTNDFGTVAAQGQAIDANHPRTGAAIIASDGVNFFVPLTDAAGRLVVVGLGAGGVSQVEILRNVQVFNTETLAALGAGATFTGATRDLLNYESIGVSVFVTAGVGALNVEVRIENSVDGATWRNADTVALAGAIGASATLNRVYASTRRYYRLVIQNLDGVNALAATEGVTTLKAVS